MCLHQVKPAEGRTSETGRMCVSDQDFLAVESIKNADEKNKFQANGVLGLAPSDDMKSIIKTMKEQKVITEEVIGLNFEDPQESKLSSTITIGSIMHQ